VSEASPVLSRLDASRTLALGGIVLIALAMLLGEIYAIFIAHVANGYIKQAWSVVMQASVGGDVETVRAQFEIIADLTEKRGRIMNTHSHLGAFGLLALMLAMLQPLLDLSAQRKLLFAWLLLGGAALHLISVYASYYLGLTVLYVSDLGFFMAVTGLAAELLALVFRRRRDLVALSDLLKGALQTKPGHLLLKAGSSLILIGMVFGFYYAWVLVTQDEGNSVAAIDLAVEHVARGEIGPAQEAIADFKRLQSKIAITAAAHSHAIEMGMLAVLLALVQGFVFLSERWRIIWAKVMLIGAFAMPLCIFLATMHGLRAAAFADLSGGLIVVGLMAMGYGIIRYTGVVDAAETGAR